MIGDQLKELREEHGLDQPQFADIANTSKQYVSQLESGRNKIPNPFFLLRWAKHFGVRLEWIIDRELPKEVSSQSTRLDADTLSEAVQVLVDTDGEPTLDNLMRIYHGIRTKAEIVDADEKRKRKGAKHDADTGRSKGVVENTGRTVHKK